MISPPIWSTPLQALQLATVEAYEDLALSFELAVQQLLPEHHYNTVGNFIRFYGDYRKGQEWNVRHFYEQYIPAIVEEEYTCVGLGLELITRLRDLEQSVSSSISLVSCEESVEDPAGYLERGPCEVSDKEHVLVCMKVEIAGRKGVLLLDPGYHVARVVTVMEDKAYPHTGWFTQTNESWVKREYRYFFPENTMNYVIWEVKEIRGTKISTLQNLIYVARPFENAVEVTEKRNLVYNFKSWLSRNIKGEVVAGVYFAVPKNNSGTFTILCTDSNSNTQRVRLSFTDFLEHKQDFDATENNVMEMCGQQLGLLPATFRELLSTVADILSDTEFILQLLDINKEINEMCP